jgi:hypothetical protein
MTETEFFEQLIQKTAKQYEKSSIFLKGEKWNYSICGSPIQKGRGIVLGINWGADDNHEPQSEMPDGKDIPTYRFINRSKDLLHKHLNVSLEPVNFNYSNLCFFRSPAENDLKIEDYRLSLPLLKEYVEYIQPPWILSLGSSNVQKLSYFGLLTDLQTFYDSQGKFSGNKARLWGYHFYSVPHPNAREKSYFREEIWKKCFS